jgi:hypothetical protein
MRATWILSTAVVAMSVTAALGAQSMKGMGTPSKEDSMSTTYTGCVESVNHGGSFLLRKIDSADADAMHGDMGMAHHDDMAMKGDAAKTMQHEQMPMADAKMDAKGSTWFTLAGSSDLSKHVGQRVSVTGSLSHDTMGTMRQDVPTLTVKSLKVLAKSCS